MTSTLRPGAATHLPSTASGGDIDLTSLHLAGDKICLWYCFRRQNLEANFYFSKSCHGDQPGLGNFARSSEPTPQ